MKNFRVGTRLIETRLFMRHPDGNWGGFTYEWNAQQTDATLVEGGAVRDIGNGQNWIFPSESQCLECHTSAAGRALGLETAQLNRNFTYPQTGRTANELATLSHIGMLSPPITDSGGAAGHARSGRYHRVARRIARAPICTPTARSVIARADRRRARWTCATRRRSPRPTRAMRSPQSGDLGIGANARLIAPGSAANSIVVNRANRRDSNAHAAARLESASTPPASRC